MAGCKKISPTHRRASKGYEAFMEGRALECSRKKTRGQLEEEWRKIRRGWYLGDETFKQRLLELIRDEGSAGEADSHTGPAVWARAEVDARQRIERGLATLGIAGKSLPELPKGAQEKLALAWWLRRHTTQSRKWIAGPLHLGHESRVTRAVREVSRSRLGRLARMRKLLEKMSVVTKTT